MKFKPISWEKVVLFGAASFAAYNYGLAGGFIEHRIFSLGGLIAGIVVNVSLAIASSRYGSIKGNKRTLQAQAAFVVMLFVSPLLVSPVIFYSLPDYFLGSQILRAAWAISWPLVADLAIVLAGAVSGKGLIHLSAEQSEQTVSKPRADLVSKKSRRLKMAEQIECRWHCGLVGSKGAMNAHSRFCVNNPANQFANIANKKGE